MNSPLSARKGRGRSREQGNEGPLAYSLRAVESSLGIYFFR
jgi:hypothetical protein